MFKKFESPLWYAYIQWPNVIDAITNCTVSPDSASRWGGRDKTCWDQLDCALSAADASQQAQYSSAATILGLLPTVLSMMAIPTHDLLRVHHRYPVLAFLLSLCNPSTFLSGLSSLKRLDPDHRSPDMLHSIRSPTFFTVQLPGTKKQIKLSNFAYDSILHLLAVGLASIMIWQAVLLGIRGVIVFACWTWHEPFTWVGVGGLTHLLSTVAWRLCLGPIDSLQSWSRWNWSLSRSGGNLELAHPHWARFFDLVFQVIGLMNYGYGTAIFSGTSLVSPLNGLTVFCLMGFSSMSSRLLAIWILEVVPEVAAEDAGTLMVDMNGSETESKVELLRTQSRTGNERI